MEAAKSDHQPGQEEQHGQDRDADTETQFLFVCTMGILVFVSMCRVCQAYSRRTHRTLLNNGRRPGEWCVRASTLDAPYN